MSKQPKEKLPRVPRLLGGLVILGGGVVSLLLVAPLLEPMESTNPASIAGYVGIFFGIGTAMSAFYKHDDYWD